MGQTHYNAVKRELFTQDFFQRLEKIRRRFYKGRSKFGEQLHAAQDFGEGLEFHDYRGYSPGDDPRYIDWNVFARLGKTFLKRFHRQEGAQICMLIDASRSMFFGQTQKIMQACWLAGGLGVIALASDVRVRLLIAADQLQDQIFVGRQQTLLFLQALQEIAPGGQGAHMRAACQLLAQQTKKQEIFIFSDFLFKDFLQSELRTLGAQAHALTILQLLAQAEEQPALQGVDMLVDAETGKELAVTITQEILANYREYYKEWLQQRRNFARQCHAHWVKVLAEKPFEEYLGALLDLSKVNP